ncbi:MAG: T9SS type A sorting domain-containing protein [Prolixibacteraceae bacterium]|nr:T9SS type A sorting domain-containing protein [Prolixibacteraceae bacterium]MBN2772981.1 T9SS type A sorting domain-containing protein [Prolixibacteraceae bacterium]
MKNFTLKTFIAACFLILTGLINAQDVIDLSAIDSQTILTDILPDIADGSTVLLGPGITYFANGYAFDKAVTFKSSDPDAAEMPKIDLGANFNMLEGANVSSIVFENISFSGPFDDKYIFNINVKNVNIGEIRFQSCKIHALRGIIRMKDNGPGLLEKYTITDCVIDSIRDYGILTVDRDDWACNEILIENSTIYRTRGFLTSKNNTNSLVIDGCTINEAPATDQRIFRWRTGGQDNVLNGITISNTVWGHGWDESGGTSYGVDGFDGLGETTWTFTNTYATNDFYFSAGKDTIDGFPNVTYNGTVAELWVDPGNGDFNFLDESFAGKSDAGDPRWAVEAEVESGTVWNISNAEFNTLGEISETVTVNGLTIYAHSGKTVTIDENGKTLDDMVFTHRLKLGGSGDFDEAGMPLGRVLGFAVDGPKKITVMAMSSSGSSDRILNIAVGNKDSLLAEFPAMGAELTKGEYIYEGGPDTIYMYSPSSGVNVYYIKVEDAPVPDLQEWNISSEDFNALGEITETVNVNGLTIHAHSGKTVTIDENGKTLDDMVFTHRLKLGGSGEFDESGNPLGRVLSFKVNGDTKITVMAMSSSGSSDRILNVATGDKDNLLAEFPAMGASLTKGEYLYTGGATTVYMYSPSSGVNVYYIKAEKLNSSVPVHKTSDFVIYPNPAENEVFVKVSEPTNIAIFSLTGKMVLQKTVNSSRESINISNLKTGMYLVRAMNGSGVTKKLIVR